MEDVVVDCFMLEKTFSTGMSFYQTYWWTEFIPTPVSALQSGCFGLGWLALAEAEEANVFYEKMTTEVADAASKVVDLTPNGDAPNRAAVPVARLCPTEADEIMSQRPNRVVGGGHEGDDDGDDEEEGGCRAPAALTRPSAVDASSTDVSACHL